MKPKNINEHNVMHSHLPFIPANECEATEALQGTRGKIDVMAQRVKLSQPVHHKDDGPEYWE